MFAMHKLAILHTLPWRHPLNSLHRNTRTRSFSALRLDPHRTIKTSVDRSSSIHVQVQLPAAASFHVISQTSVPISRKRGLQPVPGVPSFHFRSAASPGSQELGINFSMRMASASKSLSSREASSGSTSSTMVQHRDIPGPVSDILNFWFGEGAGESVDAFVGEAGTANQGESLHLLANQGLWFRKSDDTDREITLKFSHLIAGGQEGKLGSWEDTPEGALALAILLDQFTRNVFRGKPQSFEADPEALRVSQRAIDKGFDSLLPIPMRVFLYMPFMHSEDLAMSSKGIQLFVKAAGTTESPELKGLAMSFAKFAEEHRDVIARFGRFPHRNSILGRESSREEVKYLEDGGGFV